MKKTLFCLLAVAAGVCSAVEIDGVAAQVGDDTILKSDVQLEMRRLNAPASAYGQIRDEMIERRLVIRAAAASKMTMQEWVVESRIREIIQRAFDGDRNRLMDTLAKQKISYPEWHARMKDDMIVSAMRWNVIDKNVVASPAEMRAEFEAHRADYAVPAKTTVSVILLKPEDASKRAVIDAALKSRDFGDLARAFSADSKASEGGVWRDIVPADVFKPGVCEEIAKMPKGTISNWVDIDGWSFLLRKDGETPAREGTLADAYDTIEAKVRERKALAAYKAWIERLRDETFVKVY